jgi:hypothetical protein
MLTHKQLVILLASVLVVLLAAAGVAALVAMHPWAPTKTLSNFQYAGCDGVYTYDRKTKGWYMAGPKDDDSFPRQVTVDGTTLTCLTSKGGGLGTRTIVASKPSSDKNEVTWA